jgi:hypothetical protein
MALGGSNLRRPLCAFRSARSCGGSPAQARRGDRAPLQIEVAGQLFLMGRAAGFRVWLLGLLLAFGVPAPAAAAVEIAFYSRELGGNNFPHAFVSLHGTLDSTGEQVDTSYGFTAHAVTPALLFGSVTGEVVVEGARQIARSNRQFALVLSDERYRAVIAVVERWRNRPQPSYNLNHRNCVHFVAELAETVGLRVEYVQRLMKRPRSFLEHVRGLNPRLGAAP